jgi:hypothetical protein
MARDNRSGARARWLRGLQVGQHGRLQGLAAALAFGTDGRARVGTEDVARHVDQVTRAARWRIGRRRAAGLQVRAVGHAEPFGAQPCQHLLTQVRQVHRHQLGRAQQRGVGFQLVQPRLGVPEGGFIGRGFVDGHDGGVDARPFGPFAVAGVRADIVHAQVTRPDRVLEAAAIPRTV